MLDMERRAVVRVVRMAERSRQGPEWTTGLERDEERGVGVEALRITEKDTGSAKKKNSKWVPRAWCVVILPRHENKLPTTT
jgi:hypothetical protein